MRTEKISTAIASPPSQTIASAPPGQPWRAFLRSPLWVCLLIALGIRVWLVIRTHGFIDGDEAIVGIQAQHILRGELPVYYYGQPYMGSLEAYLIALLFAVFGSSSWVMRAEPILLSLVLVWLTWRLAHALATEARLSPRARTWFTTIATLFAAIPPLYDAIIELRTWGGHIETYILMLLLLLSALRLTQRWQQASIREMMLRWSGIGLLVGLGLWIYPLIAMAILAAALWIAGFCIAHIIKARRTTAPQEARLTLTSTLQRLALVVFAIPAALIGFLPALLWGANHQWANIIYLVSPANNGSHDAHLQQLYPSRLALLTGTVKLYTECVAPHVIGGALPNTRILFSLLQASVGIALILAVLALIILSFFRHTPSLARFQHLMLLPALFGLGTTLIFCASSISAAGLIFPCTRDEVGRYAAPLSLVLPFCFASIATFVYMYLSERQQVPQPAKENTASTIRTLTTSRLSQRLPQVMLLAFLIFYLAAQTSTYIRASAGYTFQSFACVVAPINNQPIIDYMQQEHIQYAWGTSWIGNAITFQTQGAIIVADPRIITVKSSDRIPANTEAVSHADRPGVLIFALHSDTHPELLRTLDAMGVTYKLARFPAEQGLDVLVITPDRTLSPFTGNSLGSWFYGC
ncbi:MAG TPA: hypothetical protein VKR06_36575 [Ktedonosporobacter sp.]|nr:hypothetical protein [Ktedonosporobacter sp.]